MGGFNEEEPNRDGRNSDSFGGRLRLLIQKRTETYKSQVKKERKSEK